MDKKTGPKRGSTNYQFIFDAGKSGRTAETQTNILLYNHQVSTQNADKPFNHICELSSNLHCQT